MPEKNKVREMLDNILNDVIVFLKGEKRENPFKNQPLYTKEELKQLYGIKKDIEKFPKHGEEY